MSASDPSFEQDLREVYDILKGVTNIEYGMHNPATTVLKPYLKDSGASNQWFIKSLYDFCKKQNDLKAVEALVYAVSFHMNTQVLSYLHMIDDAMTLDTGCQEAALAVIEGWRTKECLFILNKHLHRIGGSVGTVMRDYALKVLWELRGEFWNQLHKKEGKDLCLTDLVKNIPEYGFGLLSMAVDEHNRVFDLSGASSCPEGAFFKIPSVSDCLESIWKFHRDGIERIVSEYVTETRNPTTPYMNISVTFRDGYLYQNSAEMSFNGATQYSLTELKLMILLWFKLNGMLPIWDNVYPGANQWYLTREPAPENSDVKYVYAIITKDGYRSSNPGETY